MATPAKEVQVTGKVNRNNPGELIVLVGRIRHVPGKNAIWAKDLGLKTIHALQIANHNASAGTVLVAQVVPLPSIGAAYGSLPTRDNYASIYVRNIGTAGAAAAISAGTFGYSFVAYGE